MTALKNEFEFKTNEKSVWIKVVYTYLFDFIYTLLHFMHVHVHYI